MTWLLRDGDVLAAVEVADSLGKRAKGLLGLSGYEGAMLLPRTRSVHTLGMRFPIDVAFCDKDMVVLDTVRLRPWRLGRPRRRGRSVIEAQAGSFERWGLRIGDTVEVRG